MNTPPFLTLVTLGLSWLLSSCSSTIPTAAQMDRYHEKAAAIAQGQIDKVNGQKERGEISQDEYDEKIAKINAGISKQANDMAWARHELSESQMRAQGIPTGDHPIRVDVASQAGSESFYRPYGTAGDPYGGTNSTSASGSALNLRQGQGNATMWRGYTPGGMASQAGERNLGGY